MDIFNWSVSDDFLAGDLTFYQVAVGDVQRVALVGAGACSKIRASSINLGKSDVESERHLTKMMW